MYLGPQDILRLARLSKGIREFLMSRGSRSIWKQAFVNFGPALPACPPGLTEVQFANLAFSDNCHYCLKRPCTQIDWDLRVRCCFECETTNMTFFHSSEPPRLVCDPSVDIRKLIAIRLPTFNPAFFNADLIAVAAIYEGLGRDERAAYLDSRNRMLVDTMNCMCLADPLCHWLMPSQHARECRAWVATVMRSHRQKAILDKLISLGWSKEVHALSAESAGRFQLGGTEPLTEAEWLQIKPSIEKTLAARREWNEWMAAGAAAKQRYAAMSSGELEVVRQEQTRILSGNDFDAQNELRRQTGSCFAPGVQEYYH
ncbi:hypothetical protein C8R43DRAFT_1235297 [Mycena crocata]|nr:hypothetical protein C8R43DRAFT_1235297 [Mycena crocata]